ncbi:Carboxyl-terminal-processing peptidase 1, chloroplastic [Linum perenne]
MERIDDDGLRWLNLWRQERRIASDEKVDEWNESTMMVSPSSMEAGFGGGGSGSRLWRRSRRRQHQNPYTRLLSPAKGDEILAVNGEEVPGKSAFEVSSLLQGPNETFVTIKVKHGKCKPVQSLDVQRQVVAKTLVFYRL